MRASSSSSSYYFWCPFLPRFILSPTVLLRGLVGYPLPAPSRYSSLPHSPLCYIRYICSIHYVVLLFSILSYPIDKLVSIHRSTRSSKRLFEQLWGSSEAPFSLLPRNLKLTGTAIRSRPVCRASAVRPLGSWLRLLILNRALGLIRLFRRLYFLMQRWGLLFFLFFPLRFLSPLFLPPCVAGWEG